MPQRADRVAQRIKVIISEVLIKHVNDPRIGFATITQVQVSPDLRNARVFFSVLGDDKRKEDALAGLESAKRFIRKHLGDELDLRTVPEIEFRFDDSIEKSSKIWNMMNNLK